MRSVYGKAIWRTLREYGVWQPGSDVRLGDFGQINEGCFVREGNISDQVGCSITTIRTATLDTIFLTSEHGTRLDQEGSAKSVGSVEFSFGKKAGVLVCAEGISADSVDDLQELGLRISEVPNWKSSYRVVTSVRRCLNFAVFATSSSGGSLRLAAAPEVLQAFTGGTSKLSSDISITGAGGLRLTGNAGALSVGVHKHALWGDNLKQLEPGEIDPSTEILVPYITPVED